MGFLMPVARRASVQSFTLVTNLQKRGIAGAIQINNMNNRHLDDGKESTSSAGIGGSTAAGAGSGGMSSSFSPSPPTAPPTGSSFYSTSTDVDYATITASTALKKIKIPGGTSPLLFLP
eukprot:FR739041.1.p2 GENE.FR739041.1~~FR739041.1.p2  ORF type:complete len:119 (+),score=7.52 FR739041.1:32-388(+)